jgi:uncharacterized protein
MRSSGRYGCPDVRGLSPRSSAFKLFLLDVGLLAALCRVDATALLDGSRIFEEFKGALTEQFVLQELRTQADLDIHYWSSDAGTAEVDFLVQQGGDVWPIEVKAGENLQSKSLKVYREKYNPPLCLRASPSYFRTQGWLCNVPLYAIGALPSLLGSTCLKGISGVGPERHY